MYSIVIVDYNSIKETMEYINRCIECIFEQEDIRFIVVDNYPESETANIINADGYKIVLELQSRWRGMNLLCTKYRNHQVHFLITGRNVGYAKGNNYGIAYSRTMWKDEYVLITNNDIFFPEKLSLNEIRNFMKKSKEIAIVGPKIMGVDGQVQSPYRRLGAYYMLFWSPFLILLSKLFLIKVHNKALDYDGKSKKCYWLSGCFFMADSKKLENVGDFDDGTFLYAEEMILSERLKQYGFVPYYYDDISVIHLGSNTINRYFNNIEAEETMFNSYLHYFERYRGINRLVIVLARLHFSLIKLSFNIAQKTNHILKIRRS